MLYLFFFIKLLDRCIIKFLMYFLLDILLSMMTLCILLPL